MRRPSRTVVGWVALALAGLVIAAAAAYAASRIATQPVGLQGEPITAGRDLAPQPASTPRPSATPSVTPSATPAGSDDDSGQGRGRGGESDD